MISKTKKKWVPAVDASAVNPKKHSLQEEGSAEMPFPPGTVLLLDNCSIHKNIQLSLDRKGYTALFLSPYSPEFQPVELAFSKIKGAFRQQWPWRQSVEAAISEAVERTTESDIFGYFREANRQLDQMGNV